MAKKKFTVKSLAKKIEEENAIFEAATPAEKRVTIAYDCLARIEMGQIVTANNYFCSIDTDVKIDDSLKQALAEKKQVCSACAKGSLFMSYIGRVNNYIKHSSRVGNEENNVEHEKLLEIFTLDQLALIEFVFEGTQHINKSNDLEDLTGTVHALREKIGEENGLNVEHEDDDDIWDVYVNFINEDDERQEKEDADDIFSRVMMEYICNNIIENKGTFIL